MSKSTKNKVWEQLVRIADAEVGLLVAYRWDLTVHDRKTIELGTAGNEFIWRLGEYGTSIFPLNGTHDPVWITYYIEGFGAEKKAKFYRVTMHNAKVHQIPNDEASRLAKEYGRRGAVTARLS